MRKHILHVVMALALIGGGGALLTGCSTTNTASTTTTAASSGQAYVKTAYKAIATAGIAYRTVMQAAGELYAAGHMTEAQKAQVITYGNAFWGVYQTTVLALEEYEKLGASDAARYAKVAQGLVDIATNLANLQAYAHAVGVAVEGK